MKVLFILSIILCALISSETVSSNIVTNVFKSVKDTATGIVRKIPDSLPSVDTIFSASKNVIAGYPFKAVFKTINLFCSTALSKDQIKPQKKVSPRLNDMNFVLMTKYTQYLVPLQFPELLWKHNKFRPDLKSVILITGWTSNINKTNDAINALWNAYRCRGDSNFIALDTGAFVDTLYTWSAFNTEEMGYLLAKALVSLVSFYPVSNIHLIGHSLGAHIAGSAGRNLNSMTSQLIPRITGLDPANPCFNEGEDLSGLSRGDADFVDVIHSNPGVLGKRDAIGDCDFYPNGVRPLPPGCLSIVCAHARAWEFYAETVYPGNEYTFLGVQCNSLSALNSGYCRGYKYPMGYAVPYNIKGSAALSSSKVKPKAKCLPELSKMNFVLLTKTDRYIIPLNDSQQLWNHKSFNPAWKTKIMVTGWTSNINETNEALDTVWKAYMCRGEVNFITIDTAKFVDTLYIWSAFNTEEIGKLIAVALKELASHNASYPASNIHLIGHSLGAHIVGSAGRRFNFMTSKLIRRITGLDPANPCFNDGEVITGISRGDADFGVERNPHFYHQISFRQS